MARGGVAGSTISPRLVALVDLLRQPAVDAVAVLVRDDPFDSFELTALERAERRLDILKSFVAATEVKLARRRRELAERGQAAPVDRTLNGKRSSREQRAAAGREEVCDRLPEVEAKLAHGSIATGHADAIATATARLTDDEKAKFDEKAPDLLARAETESVDDFTRTCQNLARSVQADEGESKLNEQKRNNRVSHRVDPHTGMHHIHAELDPETGNKVITTIRAAMTSLKHRKPAPSSNNDPADADASAEPKSARDAMIANALRVIRDRADEARNHDELMVDAFVELVIGARSVDRRIPEISVLIDYQTLMTGLHERSCCETSSGDLLPPETIRRMCCDGGIVPIVLGGRSEVLDIGRKQRLATPVQRTALRAMYATCIIPGCTVPFDRTEIHHVDEWTADTGDTNLDRLAPICPHDHHRIHEGGWKLDLATDPARTISVTRPDGTIEYSGPSINRSNIAAA